MESGTLGRPSGNLSPVQSGVYLITSSRVKNPCCARAAREVNRHAPKIIDEHIVPTAARLNCRANASNWSFNWSTGPYPLFIRLEPSCSWNLNGLGHLFVHLHAQARLIERGDVTFLNNLALFDKCLPDLQMVDPVP